MVYRMVNRRKMARGVWRLAITWVDELLWMEKMQSKTGQKGRAEAILANLTFNQDSCRLGKYSVYVSFSVKYRTKYKVKIFLEQAWIVS